MGSNFNVKIDPYVLEKIDKIDYYNHIIKTGSNYRVFNFCGGQTFALNIWGSWKQHL